MRERGYKEGKVDHCKDDMKCRMRKKGKVFEDGRINKFKGETSHYRAYI